MRRLQCIFVVLLSALIGALVVNVRVNATNDSDIDVSLGYYDWNYTQVEPIIYDTISHSLIGGHILIYAENIMVTPAVPKWTKMLLVNDGYSLEFYLEYETDGEEWEGLEESFLSIIDYEDLDPINNNGASVSMRIDTNYSDTTSQSYEIVTFRSGTEQPTQDNGLLTILPADWLRIFEWSLPENRTPIILANDLEDKSVDSIDIYINIYFYDAPIISPNLPSNKIDNLSADWDIYEFDLNITFIDDSIPDIPSPTDPETAWWAWIASYISGVAAGFFGISLYPGLTIGLLVAIPFVLTLVAWIIGLIRGRSKPGGSSDDDD